MRPGHLSYAAVGYHLSAEVHNRERFIEALICALHIWEPSVGRRLFCFATGVDGTVASLRAGQLEEEAEALATAALTSLCEMRSHAAALRSAEEHLFLRREDAVRLRQRLLPLAQARSSELMRLAMASSALLLAVREKAPAEALSALAQWSGYEREMGYEEAGDALPSALPPEGTVFSAEELRWGKKEAKARLSAADFKMWREARRRQQGATSDDD